MKCDVCGATLADGATLYRTDTKGQPGVWKCERHIEKAPDPQVWRGAEALKKAP